MSKENLPETFHQYWHIQKPLPNEKSSPLKETTINNEWQALLAAIKRRAQVDLGQKQDK